MNQKFKKYWTTIVIGFKDVQSYRLSTAIWVVIDMYAFIMPLVWLTIYGTRIQINGISRNSIVAYFITIAFLDSFIMSHMDDRINSDINSGDFSRYLILPISYFWYQVGIELGFKIFRVVLMFIPFIAGAWAYQYFGYGSLSFSWQAILEVLCIVPIAYLLCAAMLHCLAETAFWLEDSWGITAGYWLVFSLFSGQMAPLALLPTWMQTITNALPFQYILAFPAGVLSGTWHKPFWLSIGIMVAWVSVFRFLGIVIEHFGIKKYSAVGN